MSASKFPEPNAEEENLPVSDPNIDDLFNEIDSVVHAAKNDLLYTTLHSVNKIYLNLLEQITDEDLNPIDSSSDNPCTRTVHKIEDEGTGNAEALSLNLYSKRYEKPEVLLPLRTAVSNQKHFYSVHSREVKGMKRSISPSLQEHTQENSRGPSDTKLYKKRKIGFCHQDVNDYVWQKHVMDLKLARKNFRGPIGIPIEYDSIVVVLDTTKAGTPFKYPIRKPKYKYAGNSLVTHGKTCQNISLTIDNADEQKEFDTYLYVEDYIDLNDISLIRELNEEYIRIINEDLDEEHGKNVFNSPNRTVKLIGSSSGSTTSTYGSDSSEDKFISGFLDKRQENDELPQTLSGLLFQENISAAEEQPVLQFDSFGCFLKKDEEFKTNQSIVEFPINSSLEISLNTSPISKINNSSNNLQSDENKKNHTDFPENIREMGDVVGITNLSKAETLHIDETVNNTVLLEDSKINPSRRAIKLDRIRSRKTNVLSRDENCTENWLKETTCVLQSVSPSFQAEQNFPCNNNSAHSTKQINTINSSSLNDGNINISTENIIDNTDNLNCNTIIDSGKIVPFAFHENGDFKSLEFGGLNNTVLLDCKCCSDQNSTTTNDKYNDTVLSFNQNSTVNENINHNVFETGGDFISIPSEKQNNNRNVSELDTSNYVVTSSIKAHFPCTAVTEINKNVEHNNISHLDAQEEDAMILCGSSNSSACGNHFKDANIAKPQNNDKINVHSDAQDDVIILSDSSNSSTCGNHFKDDNIAKSQNNDKNNVAHSDAQDDVIILSDSSSSSTCGNRFKDDNVAKSQTNDKNTIEMCGLIGPSEDENKNIGLSSSHNEIMVLSNSNNFCFSDDTALLTVKSKENIKLQEIPNDIVNSCGLNEFSLENNVGSCETTNVKTENAAKSLDNLDENIINLVDSSLDSIISIKSDNVCFPDVHDLLPAPIDAHLEEKNSAKSAAGGDVTFCGTTTSNNATSICSNDNITSNVNLLDLTNHRKDSINDQNGNRIKISSSTSNDLFLPCAANCFLSKNMAHQITNSFVNNGKGCNENLSSKSVQICENFENSCNKENVDKLPPSAQDIPDNRMEFPSDEDTPLQESVLRENSKGRFFVELVNNQNEGANTGAPTDNSISAQGGSTEFNLQAALLVNSSDEERNVTTCPDVFRNSISENLPDLNRNFYDSNKNIFTSAVDSRAQNIEVIINGSTTKNKQFNKTKDIDLVPSSISITNNDKCFSVGEMVEDFNEKIISKPTTDDQHGVDVGISNNCLSNKSTEGKEFSCYEIPHTKDFKKHEFSASSSGTYNENVGIADAFIVETSNSEGLISEDVHNVNEMNENFKTVGKSCTNYDTICSSENVIYLELNGRNSNNLMDYHNNSSTAVVGNNNNPSICFEAKDVFSCATDAVKEEFKKQYLNQQKYVNNNFAVDDTDNLEVPLVPFTNADISEEKIVLPIATPIISVDNTSTSTKQNSIDISSATIGTEDCTFSSFSPGLPLTENATGTPAKVEISKKVVTSFSGNKNNITFDIICTSNNDISSTSKSITSCSIPSPENSEQTAQVCKYSVFLNEQPCNTQKTSTITSNYSANTSDFSRMCKPQFDVVKLDPEPPFIPTTEIIMVQSTKQILELPSINSEIGVRPNLPIKTSHDVLDVSIGGSPKTFIPTINLNFDSITASQHDRDCNRNENCTITSSAHLKNDHDNYRKRPKTSPVVLDQKVQKSELPDVSSNASQLKIIATPMQTLKEQTQINIPNPALTAVDVTQPKNDNLKSNTAVPSSNVPNVVKKTTGMKRPAPPTSKDKEPAKKYKSSSADANRTKSGSPFTVNHIDDGEVADNNDPRWKLYNFTKPEDCFLAVCNQWCKPVPDPHENLTKRFCKKNFSNKGSYVYSGNDTNKTVDFLSIYEDQLREINQESTKLKHMLDTHGAFWKRRRVDEVIDKLRELDNIQNHLHKAWDEGHRFYTFYKTAKTGHNAKLITEFKRNEIKHQLKILNQYEQFYQSSD